MCMIIYNPTGKAVCQNLINRQIKSNPDGFGYLNLASGNLVRTMSKKYIRRLVAKEAPYVVHFRYATVGKVGRKNVHPFTSGDYLVFMNGTINDLADRETCDTKVVAESLQYVKEDCIEQYLSMFDVRFLVYNTVTQKVIRTGDWSQPDEYVGDGIWFSRDPSPVVYESAAFRSYSGQISYYKSGGYWKPAVPFSDEDQYNGQPFESDGVYGDDETAEATIDLEYELAGEEDCPSYHPDVVSDGWDDRWDEVDYQPVLDSTGIVPLKGKSIVAVYGTLKQGGANSHLLNHAGYLGRGLTRDPMRLVIAGLPYVIRGSDPRGEPLMMELYEVSSAEMAALDRLEGHPHFYRREKLTFETVDLIDNASVRAWCYMVGDEYDTGSYSSSWENKYNNHKGV